MESKMEKVKSEMTQTCFKTGIWVHTILMKLNPGLVRLVIYHFFFFFMLLWELWQSRNNSSCWMRMCGW